MHLKSPRGFTLVELIVVMVIIGVLAGGMIMFFKPALNNYLDVSRRASLANLADGALRVMTTEVRTAVPNSLRLINAQCLEMLPTSDGGRFRSGPDTDWDAKNPADPSKFIDATTGIADFDVLSTFSNAPKAGDWVVIGNQNGNDAYAGFNRAAIAAVLTSATATGTARISMATPIVAFPPGYEGGRFVIVPDASKAVSYVCSGAGIDANGTGTGRLLRMSNYGFNAVPSCPGAAANSPVLATKVASCTFIYDPNQGATQQSGFVEVQLTLSEAGESASLSYGAHVSNVP